MIATAAWGTGNVGRAAIRAVSARPALTLTAVLVHDTAKVGVDAGTLAGLDHELVVAATDGLDAVLAGKPRFVVYAASATSGSTTRSPTWCGRCGPAPWPSYPRCTRSTTSATRRRNYKNLF